MVRSRYGLRARTPTAQVLTGAQQFVEVVKATVEAPPSLGLLLRCGEPWAAVARGHSIRADGGDFMP